MLVARGMGPRGVCDGVTDALLMFTQQRLDLRGDHMFAKPIPIDEGFKHCAMQPGVPRIALLGQGGREEVTQHQEHVLCTFGLPGHLQPPLRGNAGGFSRTKMARQQQLYYLRCAHEHPCAGNGCQWKQVRVCLLKGPSPGTIHQRSQSHPFDSRKFPMWFPRLCELSHMLKRQLRLGAVDALRQHADVSCPVADFVDEAVHGRVSG